MKVTLISKIITLFLFLNFSTSSAQEAIDSNLNFWTNPSLGINANKIKNSGDSKELDFYNLVDGGEYIDRDKNISINATKYFTNNDISNNFIYGFSVTASHLKKFEGQDTDISLGGNAITLSGNYINPEIRAGFFLDQKKSFLINASHGYVFSDIKHRFGDDNVAGCTLDHKPSKSLSGKSKGLELAYNDKSKHIYKVGIKKINFDRVNFSHAGFFGNCAGGTYSFSDKLKSDILYIGIEIPISWK
jgi:hypothetical protein